MIRDEQGCSTCPAGEERHEKFTVKLGRKTMELVQYDYRTPAGKLFSCAAKTLDEARTKRDNWLEKEAAGSQSPGEI
jgi:hypothetical protein